MNPKSVWRWVVIGAALLTGLLAVSLITRVQSELGAAPNEVHADSNRLNLTKSGDAVDSNQPKRSVMKGPGGDSIKPILASLDHAKNPFFSPALAAVRVRERQAAEQARIEAEALKEAEAKAMREAAAEAERKAEEAERAWVAKEKADADAAKKKAEEEQRLAAEKAKEDARLAAEKAAAEKAATPPPKVIILRYQGMFAAGGNVGALIGIDDEPASYRRIGELVGGFRLEQITRDSVDLLTTGVQVQRLSVPAGESKSFRENGAPHEE